MEKCNTQEKDLVMIANNWVTPGASNPGRYSVEEPGQSLVLSRVEFPQIKSPPLTWEDQAEEHDLDYGDKLELLACHIPDTFLESIQLHQ